MVKIIFIVYEKSPSGVCRVFFKLHFQQHTDMTPSF